MEALVTILGLATALLAVFLIYWTGGLLGMLVALFLVTGYWIAEEYFPNPGPPRQ